MNTQLVERKQVEGTPFQIVTTDEGSFVALGNWACTYPQSLEMCEKAIAEKSWDLIFTVLSIMIATNKQQENE